MKPISERDALTTGQIARLCGVSSRMACAWIDKGLLKGWRVPGSDHRRVAKADLIQFIKKHELPIPEELK